MTFFSVCTKPEINELLATQAEEGGDQEENLEIRNDIMAYLNIGYCCIK